MVYVYDTLINFSEDMYDFYDWEDTDEFLHIRRIPLYKVSKVDYNNFICKKNRINEEMMESIKDKTQVFSNRGVEIIDFACVITDGSGALALEFDESGVTKRKSKFLINEEMEILDMAKNLKEAKLKYEVISKNRNKNNMIRSERKVLNSILEELSSLKNDYEIIDYLYYEWFNKYDGNNKYEKLVKDLKNKFTDKHLEFLDLLNLMMIKK